jgi:hypothetical protein
MLAVGTESGSVLGPQHLGMLSEAAERRTLLLLYHRADVRLGQLMLGAKVRSERTD